MHKKSRALRQLFQAKSMLRIVGAHDGLGAQLIERNGFEGVWASGLEISTAHAVPDANILTMTEYFLAASAMNEATSLPVICDCDTGFGNAANVMHMVKKYEQSGLAAVVIEDKRFPKVNSFVPGRQDLAPMEEFMGKLEAAKNAQKSDDFMVFARIEALIAGWGIEEALRRAYAYAEAGADGIVIHSKASSPDEIFTFAKKWKGKIPLVAIPTTYSQVTTSELSKRGFRMVIYANHGLRASIKAMDEVFQSIAGHGSTALIEKKIASLKEVFEIQGMFKMKEDERKFDKREIVQAVIPAAGDHRELPGLSDYLLDKPLCMLDIGGKALIERQADLLRSSGVTDICVVGGYQSEKIKVDGAEILYNPDYKKTSNAYSFMFAEDTFRQKCLMVYSDIVFDREIVERVLKSPYTVTLVIDRAYRTLPYREKRFDLVIAKDPAKSKNGRSLDLNEFKPVVKVGRNIPKEDATHEFIGIAFFREEGLRALKSLWQGALLKFKRKPFYEAPSIQQADFVDLAQYLLDRRCPVYGMEIEHGWSEIRSLGDYERIHTHFLKSPQIVAAKT